ncbi:MAG: hypothetical protein ABR584_03860 [Candidatus Baltobacteraceae bacterium]
MLAAVTAGLLAGAYIGTRHRAAPPSRALVALETPVQLAPAMLEATAPLPVIYDAYFEEAQRRPWLPWCTAAIVCLALIAALAFAARPRFTALAAPATVLAGSSANISYATAGYGTAHFTIEDGQTHRSGSLHRGDGTFAFQTTAKSGDLIGSLVMQSPLGTDARIVHVHVMPVPAPVIRTLASTAPVIRNFHLSSSSAKGGETIAASFQTNASAGNLRLVDASGAVWLSRPIRSNGTVQFAAPLMHRDTPFIVVLHAERNNQSLEASAGFIAQARVTAPKESHPMPQFFRQPSFTIPAVVHGGTAFSILVPQAITGVTVALSSKDGTDLAGPASQNGDRVRVYAPRVSAAQQSFASVSFQNGKQKETVIRRILIVP